MQAVDGVELLFHRSEELPVLQRAVVDGRRSLDFVPVCERRRLAKTSCAVIRTTKRTG